MERISNRPSGPRGRARELSSDETRLWERTTADVRPLRGRPADPLQQEQPPGHSDPDEPGEPSTPPLPVRVPRHQPANAHSAPGDRELAPGIAAGIDRRTVVRLRRGLLPPESEVDLHCCTQPEAYQVLQAFLAASQIAGRRCVLVITGKGYGTQGAVGVLKTMVPRWLNEPPNRARVLAFCHATPAHGGEGALYVLLRRIRGR